MDNSNLTRAQQKLIKMQKKASQLKQATGMEKISTDRLLSNPAIQEIKQEIAKKGTPEQTYFSFMPYDVARTSPFFPMSKKEMKNRTHVELTWENNWGKITIEGYRLSIYDESVLLALLSMVQRDKSEKLYTTVAEICEVMGVNNSGENYQSITESLKRLVGTQITLLKKLKKNYKPVMSNNIIVGFLDSKKYEITVNPYFLQMYTETFVSYINLKFRSSISGDIAKALYRFYNAQQKDKVSCNIITLSKAINLDPNLPLYKLRDRLRRAVRELKAKGYLSKHGLAKNDVLTVWKTPKNKKLHRS